MPLPVLIADNLVPLAPAAEAARARDEADEAAAASVPFTMEYQQQDNWCWAAVAVSVARAYIPGFDQSQCDLASQELVALLGEGVVCCPAGSNPDCDVAWSVRQALEVVGCLDPAQEPAGPVGMEEVRAEILAGRVVVVQITWSGGARHFVVVSGYGTPGPGWVTVRDPLHGRSNVELDFFPAAYQTGATWDRTYFTVR